MKGRKDEKKGERRERKKREGESWRRRKWREIR